MIYTKEVEMMCPVAKGAKHEPAPIPEEGKWVHAKQIGDISGFTHGIGWCAPQQGACKLSLNVKNGVIEEALIETIGCSGMTHSAAMAAEILQGKTAVESSLILLVKGGYLLVDMAQLLGVGCLKTGGPAFQARHLAQPTEDGHGNAVLIAPRKNIKGSKAEGDDSDEDNSNDRCQRQVADSGKTKI